MDMNEKVRNYIEANMIVFDDEIAFSDEDNIFSMGFVNSLFAMKLLGFIEQEFGITVESEDMDISNFSTVNNIINLINRKMKV